MSVVISHVLVRSSQISVHTHQLVVSSVILVCRRTVCCSCCISCSSSCSSCCRQCSSSRLRCCCSGNIPRARKELTNLSRYTSARHKLCCLHRVVVQCVVVAVVVVVVVVVVVAVVVVVIVVVVISLVLVKS